MSPGLHRILIAGCALVAGLHGPRAVALLSGAESAARPHSSVRAAETHASHGSAALAATRAQLFQGPVPGGPFTTLLGMLSAAPGS